MNLILFFLPCHIIPSRVIERLHSSSKQKQVKMRVPGDCRKPSHLKCVLRIHCINFARTARLTRFSTFRCACARPLKRFELLMYLVVSYFIKILSVVLQALLVLRGSHK